MLDKSLMLGKFEPLLIALSSIQEPACVRLAGDLGPLIEEIRSARDEKTLADLNDNILALSLRAMNEIAIARQMEAGQAN